MVDMLVYGESTGMNTYTVKNLKKKMKCITLFKNIIKIKHFEY